MIQHGKTRMVGTEHEDARGAWDATLTRRRALGLVAGSAALGMWQVAPRAAVSRTSHIPWLVTSGNRIVTADAGQAVLLRGVNNLHSEWVRDMAWEQQAIPEVALRWNGNIWVRGFAADPVNSDDQHYLGMLDEYVSLTERHRMYLVFSFRSYDINGELPTSLDSRATQALTRLATRYRGKPSVLYSLQAEPHDVDWASLRPLFEEMVDSIRAAAAPHVPLILVPGTNWSRDLSGAIDDPVRRDNLVYNSHPYNPAADFQALFGAAHDAGLPVFVGEFGPFDAMTMADVVSLLRFTRERGIGWAAWSFDPDLDDPLHKLVHSTLVPTTPYGTTVRSEMLATPPLP
jgi:hypothetical protein